MGAAKEQMYENNRAEIDSHVAQELGISTEDLDSHPYELDEHASDDGVLYGWAIRWEDTAPLGVEPIGGVSFIQPLHVQEPEDPEN